jgi:hypothetical protein
VALLAVLLVLGSAAAPVPRLDGAWNLGRGYKVVVYETGRFPGSTYAHRTLTIRHRGRVVRSSRYLDEGLGVLTQDITGDGVRDVLALDYQDGSGGCGTYHVYGGPHFGKLWTHTACIDTGFARMLDHALVTWFAVPSSKTRDSRSSVHCCWRLWRRSEWRWQNGGLRLASRSVGGLPHLRPLLPPGSIPAP